MGKTQINTLKKPSLQINNSKLHTPKTEIEAFLSSVKPYVKPYDGITSCSGRWFSTAPLVRENIFPGETICGQVCLTRVQEVGLGFAPPPTPVKGDCPSRGYTIDSGESFNAIPFPGFPSARVFTKP